MWLCCQSVERIAQTMLRPFISFSHTLVCGGVVTMALGTKMVN